MLVERPRALVLGVHQDDASADRIRGLTRPRQRLEEHPLAEVMPLLARVDGEARKQNGDDGLRLLAPQRLGTCLLPA